MKELLQRVDELIANGQLPWRRQGDSVEVRLGGSERRQSVQLEEREEFYVFRSVVLREPKRVSSGKLRNLAYRCWCRNARKALVTFAMEPGGRVVGLIEQPKATLDHEELQLYVEVLAQECDRFEFVLSGEDAE